MMNKIEQKIVLISNAFVGHGGREILTQLNQDVLRDIFKDRLLLIQAKQVPIDTPLRFARAFRGYIDGIDSTFIEGTLTRIKNSGATTVFVDGSNLGAIVAAVKGRFPTIDVIVFFHNVEAQFFWGSLKRRRSPRSFLVMVVNYLAERKSVKFADKIICLSKRDSSVLARLYGRGADNISPLAVRDVKVIDSETDQVSRFSDYILFVGGSFYANRAGIEWFTKHVSPHVNILTVVIGFGMEDIRDKLEARGNVNVVGRVDNLVPWYQNAKFVIAPIFDGSGMKTKVAEALMFGKKIVATKKAFSGYEDFAKDVGWECSTAEEFIRIINDNQDLKLPSFDRQLRNIFDREYSYEAARARLIKIVDKKK